MVIKPLEILSLPRKKANMLAAMKKVCPGVFFRRSICISVTLPSVGLARVISGERSPPLGLQRIVRGNCTLALIGKGWVPKDASSMYEGRGLGSGFLGGKME